MEYHVPFAIKVGKIMMSVELWWVWNYDECGNKIKNNKNVNSKYNKGTWCNGSIGFSKNLRGGSSPSVPANKKGE